MDASSPFSPTGGNVSAAANAVALQYDAEAVDTLILLSYMDMNAKDDVIVEFLTANGPHSCNVRICAPILEKHKRHDVLLELYRTRGCHELALQLLQKLEVCMYVCPIVTTMPLLPTGSPSFANTS